MKSFILMPKLIFIKWSMPGKSVVPAASCCQCPQYRLCPTQPQKEEEGTRIPLIEPEIMVSGEHKYSWNANKEVITYLYKHWCLQNSPWKDLAFTTLLSLSHVPGERIGDICLYPLAQYIPSESFSCWNFLCLTPSAPSKQTCLMTLFQPFSII